MRSGGAVVYSTATEGLASTDGSVASVPGGSVSSTSSDATWMGSLGCATWLRPSSDEFVSEDSLEEFSVSL